MSSSRNLGKSHVDESSTPNQYDDFFDQPFEENEQQHVEEQVVESGRGRGGRGGAQGEGRGGAARGRAPRQARESKSETWVHWRKKQIDEDDFVHFRVECNYCDQWYNFTKGGGHGSLNAHTNRKHPEKIGIGRDQTQLQFAPSATQGSSSISPSVLFKFNSVIYRKELCKFVCVKGLPFNFADDDFYERFIRLSLNPAASKVPRSNLVRDIKKVVLEYKKLLIDVFSKLENKVSICADGWSDHWQRNSYLGVTCHWIDNSWSIQKRLIAYESFEPPHTAENICRKLNGIFESYGILGKKFSISFDNASANTASLPELIRVCQPSLGGKFFHIRCLCHIINLCVKDGLNALEEYVLPIRKGLSFIAKNNKVTTKWIKYLRNKKIQEKYFNLDVPTRWNSTYQMLIDGFEYKEHVMDFFMKMGYEVPLFSYQWNACTNLCQLLKVFNTATLAMSGVYYPTSVLVLEQCVAIVTSFNNLQNCDILKDCIFNMREKWIKYFDEIPSLFLVAKILDPRVSLEDLEYIITFYYLNLYPNGNGNNLHPKIIVQNTKNDLLNLFNEYNAIFGNPSQDVPPPISQQPIGGSQSNDPYDFFDQLYSKKRARVSSSSSSSSSTSNIPYELDHYFNTNFDVVQNTSNPREFDVLKWWSQRSTTYPILSIIAKEVLACPASTVAVESAFSVGGNVLDARRSQLTVQNLENQLLLGDWVRAEKREQDMPYEEDLLDPQYQYDLEESTTGSD